MCEAIILAGGLGTRLRSVLPDLPKSMAPVADKPFLAWQIEYLATKGVDRIVLSLGYKADVIKDYFGHGYAGVSIDYVIEDSPLGTGGAILMALRVAQSDRVFVVFGDTLVDVDLSALRDRVVGADMIGVGVKRVADAGRYGRVEFDEYSHRVTGFSEKKGGGAAFINAGVYDLPRSLIDRIDCPSPFSFETEILQRIGRGIAVGNNPLWPLVACPVGDFFIDIGIPEDFVAAQTLIPEWVARKSQ